MPSAIYIADIKIAAAIDRKINEKHGVTFAEVREAFILRRDVVAKWETHADHGRRVVATGSTYLDRLLIAALYPVSPKDGVWTLMTARELKR